jgi:hypothetical protein
MNIPFPVAAASHAALRRNIIRKNIIYRWGNALQTAVPTPILLQHPFLVFKEEAA